MVLSTAMCEFSGPYRCFFGFSQWFIRLVGGIKEHLRKGYVSHDSGQNVVEIVGNASGEGTQGFQLFKLEIA
jgi:hypothetical protein